MTVEYIIVQAGGRGSRLSYLTRNKPKALVPVQNLPMIFHLFRAFPGKKFIVIGDYKISVLREYLAVFADVDYTLVDSSGKNGTCAGLSAALALIPEGKAFMLTWCDLILPERYVFPAESGCYIGIAKSFLCRWKYVDGVFAEEASDRHGVAGHFIFPCKGCLKTVPDSGEFVRWLSLQKISFRELPLEHAREIGLLSEYEKLGDEKCRPFNRITVQEGCIVKEGLDEQGKKLAVREKAWYARVSQEHFANIPKIYSYNPLTMEKINGKNVYEYTDLSFCEKEKILGRIIGSLQSLHNLEAVPADRSSFYEAYIGKTFERLEKVRHLVPFADSPVVKVNGRCCRNVFFQREPLERIISSYIPKNFRLIHGDCTFSNLMLRADGTPILIDPRGYFGATELYGDVAYDWAKLYYSIVGNYDQFNLRHFRLTIGEDDVALDIASNHWEDMEDAFFALLPPGWGREQIKMLHAIIWLSLTTYAWQDYDSVCGAFYNGLWYLEDVL